MPTIFICFNLLKYSIFTSFSRKSNFNDFSKAKQILMSFKLALYCLFNKINLKKY